MEHLLVTQYFVFHVVHAFFRFVYGKISIYLIHISQISSIKITYWRNEINSFPWSLTSIPLWIDSITFRTSLFGIVSPRFSMFLFFKKMSCSIEFSKFPFCQFREYFSCVLLRPLDSPFNSERVFGSHVQLLVWTLLFSRIELTVFYYLDYLSQLNPSYQSPFWVIP